MIKEELSKTLKSMTLGELAEIFYPNEKEIIENINLMKDDEETVFYTISYILEKETSPKVRKIKYDI